MWHWLLVFFGVDNEAGRGYAFWSGIGSDIGEIALIGLLYQNVRKHNCHVKGCPRIGRHHIGDYIVCRRHHPTDAPTPTDIANASNHA